MIVRAAFDDARVQGLLAEYFAELKARFGYEPPSPEEQAVGAEVFVCLADDGQALATAALRELEEGALEVKRMYVTPAARGQGQARRLLRHLEAEAWRRGATRVVMDTATSLTEAAALYLSEGYEEVAAYNQNPYAGRWFEKRRG